MAVDIDQWMMRADSVSCVLHERYRKLLADAEVLNCLKLVVYSAVIKRCLCLNGERPKLKIIIP